MARSIWLGLWIISDEELAFPVGLLIIFIEIEMLKPVGTWTGWDEELVPVEGLLI